PGGAKARWARRPRRRAARRSGGDGARGARGAAPWPVGGAGNATNRCAGPGAGQRPSTPCWRMLGGSPDRSSTMKIQAAVTRAQGAPFSIEEVRLSGPGPGEVLVRVVATGVCHTDAVGRDLAVSPYPMVRGHEGSGIVERVGEGVDDLAPGDHVVMSFAHCGRCGNCLTGHPTVCEAFNELNFGGRMEDGGARLHHDDGDLSTFF